MNLIGIPFVFAIDLFYVITENFGFAIILFTLLTRIVLFPLSYMSHKNSVTLFKIQPQLADIKARYGGEPGTMLSEQKTLYKKEKYSTIKGLLPLVFQILIIIGVIGAVNSSIADARYNFNFLSLDLSAIPTYNSTYIVIPVFSAFSALLLCLTQNAVNPLTKTQGFLGRWGTTIFLTVFSGYFAFVCQAGVGLYWIAGNIFSILVTFICVLIYSPKKYADLTKIVYKNKQRAGDKKAQRERIQAEKQLEKEDTERFYNTKKELVFYSEASGYYKYFKHYIEYILENSDITIHYVTSDINDQIFEHHHPRLVTYFCTPSGLITLMMKMDADVVVMTLPDLGQYHIKRSLVKKDIEYIYTDHGFGSINIVFRKGALDYYDTVFCCGKNYNEELRAMEKIYNLPEKTLVNTGFGLMNSLIREYESIKDTRKENNKKQIMLAPSWQKDNILEYCLDEIMSQLLTNEYKVILRPHPEFIKRFPGKMEAIFAKYENQIGDSFEIQTDFSSNSDVYLSDIVITDWSSIAQEFSFVTKKPSLFINTPMKIMNPEWERLGIEPIDIRLRDVIGISIDTDKLGTVGIAIKELLDEKDEYKDKIAVTLKECIYNIDESNNYAKIGGDYIINRVREKVTDDSSTNS